MSAFSNENIKVLATRGEGCLVTFEIFVQPEASQKAFQEALKTIKKDVEVPGFRKGKTPDPYILQRFGTRIESEWKDTLLNKSFQEAMQLTSIFPREKNSVRSCVVEHASKEDESKLKIVFESVPVIPSVDPQSIGFETIGPKSVTQEDIDNMVKQVQLFHAVWNEVTDRPIQQGDYVEVDIEGIEPNVGMISKNARLEMKTKGLATWLYNLLIEKNAGDVVEGTSEQETSHDPSCIGCETGEHPPFQPTKCRVTIKKILNPELPPVDDELAKKVGTSDANVFLERVRERLEKEAFSEAKFSMYRDIENRLINQYSFDLPLSLLNEYTQAEIREDRNEEAAKERAIRSLRLGYLFAKISEENNLQVGQEEIVQEMIREMMANPSIAQNESEQQLLHSRIHNRLFQEKVLDFLLEKGKQVS